MLLEGKKLLITGVLTPQIDRVLGGAGRPGARRRDRPHELRTNGEPHREDGEAAPRPPRRPRDGRERARADRRRARGARPALGTARRLPARDRVRAPGRPRRQLPPHAMGERRDRVQDERVLAEVPGGRHAAADGVRRWRRSCRSTSTRRVAWPDLRLDGCREGRARVRDALPGAGPRPEGDPREHRLGRTDEDDGRQGHPRLRPDRGELGGSRAARLGHDRPVGRSPARSRSSSRISSAGITGELLHVDGGFHAMGTEPGEPASDGD